MSPLCFIGCGKPYVKIFLCLVVLGNKKKKIKGKKFINFSYLTWNVIE